MGAMKELATALGIDYAAPDAAGHTNRIRYPRPNRLGLIKPTPWIETIAGRVIEN